MIEHGEVFVKLARIQDGTLVDLQGHEYYLHTADCDLATRGGDCDCYGTEVLDELVAAILQKEV